MMMPSRAAVRPLTRSLGKGHTAEAWCSTRRKAPEHNWEWGWADPVAAPKTPAAPATVSGEGLRSATGPKGLGRPEIPVNREPGDRPCKF
jgi:hypothetical protein